MYTLSLYRIDLYVFVCVCVCVCTSEFIVLRELDHTQSNKMGMKKHLNEYHYNTSTSHHNSLNCGKRFKCETSHCVPHNTQHSTQHCTNRNTQHSAHNFDKRQKTDIHQNSNENSNSNEFATPVVQDTVLSENSYVTRAAVVNYCK